MNRTIFYSLVSLALNTSVFSQILDQRRDWEWRVGGACIGADTTVPGNYRGNTIIRFPNGGNPTTQYYCPADRNLGLNFDFTTSEICDTSGRLVLASNGYFIGNEDGDTLVGGRINVGEFIVSTYGRRAPQGAIFLPKPGTVDKYIFFNLPVYVTLVGYPKIDRLYISEIDMSLNQGRGEVIIQNQLVLTDSTMSGRITACRHANGRDWWVVVARSDIPRYHFFLLQPDGVHYHGYQDTPGYNMYTGAFGTTDFSPDGTRFMRMDAFYPQDPVRGTYISLFDFDRCTGILSNARLAHFPIPAITGGGCFSPDSRLLYFTIDTFMMQVDATQSNPFTSLDTIWRWDGGYDVSPAVWPTWPSIPHVGPDGRIYVMHSGLKDYHIIPYPDTRGQGCGFIPRGLITPSIRNFNMPNYPHFRLGRLEGSPCDTVYIGVSEVDDGGVKIYPNPATHVLTIETTKSIGVIEIFDVLGRPVSLIQLQSNISTLDISEYARGVYLVKVTDEGGRFVVKKIVVE